MACEVPIMGSTLPAELRRRVRGALLARLPLFVAVDERMECSRRFISIGLVKKSCAPPRRAFTAESMLLSADNIIKGMPASGMRLELSEIITSNGI